MNNLYRLIRYDLPLHFVIQLTNWLPDNVIFLRFRGLLCSPFFASCGKNLRLGRKITFYNASKIRIGNNVYIAQDNWFCAGETITIEDEVMFGPKCVIVSANHTRTKGSFRYGKGVTSEIYIGFGSWISAQCTITAGVIIGTGCLIAANTAVTSNVPDNNLVASGKSKTIRQIIDND